jgi:SAM-dependent methyltransferase
MTGPRAQPPADAGDYYDVYWSEHGYDPPQVMLPPFRAVLERRVRPDASCIDVGCGRGGGPSAWLAAHTASYVGVDISDQALAVARAAGLNVQRIDDASELPFPDSSFDVALCAEVLEHLVDPCGAAREIRRVLRPGGILICTVPNIAYWRRRVDMALFGRWHPLGDNQSTRRPWRDPHLRFFGRGNLRNMLREAGYDPVVVGGHGISWMTDVPGVRRLMRRDEAGPVYERLVEAAPSVFAHRFHAIATKPAA